MRLAPILCLVVICALLMSAEARRRKKERNRKPKNQDGQQSAGTTTGQDVNDSSTRKKEKASRRNGRGNKSNRRVGGRTQLSNALTRLGGEPGKPIEVKVVAVDCEKAGKIYENMERLVRALSNVHNVLNGTDTGEDASELLRAVIDEIEGWKTEAEKPLATEEDVVTAEHDVTEAPQDAP